MFFLLQIGDFEVPECTCKSVPMVFVDFVVFSNKFQEINYNLYIYTYICPLYRALIFRDFPQGAPRWVIRGTSLPIPCLILPLRLVLEHFKPKLHNLFRSFARRQLRGPTDARQGQGTTRLKERTIWKQTQDTIFASRASSILGATLKDEAPEMEDEVCTEKKRMDVF